MKKITIIINKKKTNLRWLWSVVVVVDDNDDQRKLLEI